MNSGISTSRSKTFTIARNCPESEDWSQLARVITGSAACTNAALFPPLRSSTKRCPSSLTGERLSGHGSSRPPAVCNDRRHEEIHPQEAGDKCVSSSMLSAGSLLRVGLPSPIQQGSPVPVEKMQFLRHRVQPDIRAFGDAVNSRKFGNQTRFAVL